MTSLLRTVAIPARADCSGRDAHVGHCLDEADTVSGAGSSVAGLGALLSRQLLHRAGRLRYLTAHLATGGGYSGLEQYLEECHLPLDRLREIVRDHGWPTYVMVGREGGDAALYLAVHCTADLDFQRTCRQLIAVAVEAKQTPWAHLVTIEQVITVTSCEPLANAGNPRIPRKERFMNAATQSHARLVYHPAGRDGDLRNAVEELRAGRWMAARGLLAASWGDWTLWTSRTQVLGAAAARSDVLRRWEQEEPEGLGLATLQARAAVEVVALVDPRQADPRQLAWLEQSAREACWRAAATVADDPVPWVCLLALAGLDQGQVRPEHRAPAPDPMLPPGPWGLLEQARRADLWNREAYHRMFRFWLALARPGTATTFLRTYLGSAPAGSPLYALPLHLHVERYRTASRRDAVRRQWSDGEVLQDVLLAYEHWLAAPGGRGKWPVVDESYLAHALWASHHLEQAGGVFASLAPFASSQPWLSLADRREQAHGLLQQVMTQIAARR
ncbi:hypothetical protein [Kitasatospora sp. NPDC087315]|uniref:hypothetical protein n=1 Tax=Kitasatospora sp. NPDC087315 TaxID=3364069 RepID=UPI00381CE921